MIVLMIVLVASVAIGAGLFVVMMRRDQPHLGMFGIMHAPDRWRPGHRVRDVGQSCRTAAADPRRESARKKSASWHIYIFAITANGPSITYWDAAKRIGASVATRTQ
jgi:hypothetical protein